VTWPAADAPHRPRASRPLQRGRCSGPCAELEAETRRAGSSGGGTVSGTVGGRQSDENAPFSFVKMTNGPLRGRC